MASATFGPLAQRDHRAGVDLFRAAMHLAPTPDESWPAVGAAVSSGDFFGAWSGPDLIGVCQALPMNVTVPGGALVEARAVGRFAVRADRSGRGVGTGLMTAFLDSVTSPLVLLRSSAGNIYRRFGFDVATWTDDVRIDRRTARFHSAGPGDVRLLPITDAAPMIVSLYRRLRPRPGMVQRPGIFADLLVAESTGLSAVIHRGADGDDAFAIYFHRPGRTAAGDSIQILEVGDMHYATAQGWQALMHHLLSIGSVDEVLLRHRPIDEPTEWLFTDPRVCTKQRRDELWLRVHDVPAALSARVCRSDEPLTLYVRDPVYATRSGCFETSSGTVRSTDRRPDLSMDLQTLGALFLGGIRASSLAAAGRIDVLRASAVHIADRTFDVAEVPWCGTGV